MEASMKRPSLYLGIDVGTTTTKAMVLDTEGRCQGRGQVSNRVISPQPGQFVQDAHEWQDAVAGAVRSACSNLDTRHIAALTISAQGGTLVAVDEHHRALAPARLWLDRRATRSAAIFERVFGAKEFYRRTGWPIAPNNTAAQLLDLAAADPETFARASCFCDTAAYVNGWLTGTPTIDSNVAGITNLIGADSARWDLDILETIGVATDRLPRIAPPGSAIGRLTERAANVLGVRPGTVVGAGAQDQYCAALGARAVDLGDVLLSTGTAWVLLAVASGPYGDPRDGIGCGHHVVSGLWGHFGEVSNGGVSLEWARRLLAHGDRSPVPLEDLDTILARTAPGAQGLSFFPFFDGTGLDDELETSRGSLLGLSLSHDHRDFLRAIAEGVAFAMRILLERYRASVGAASHPPIVVGGAARSREWMQLLAAVLGSDLLVSCEPDAACVGAAILAATAVGDVSDARSGAQRLGGPRKTVAAESAATRVYDDLFVNYASDARVLSELYSARPQTSPEGITP
jgi:xylulokinase